MVTKRNFALVLATIALAFSMLGAAFQPASAAESSAETLVCSQWYTVQRGDYLVKIARMYGTTWRELAELNSLSNPSRIYPGQKLCVDGTGSAGPVQDPEPDDSVRVYAQSVSEDEYATLRGRGLFASSTYTVYMSRYGTNGSVLIKVGTATTDRNGAFTRTFFIPSGLIDVARIKVSLFNGMGDSATNWFINATSDEFTGGNGAPAFSFQVLSVVEDVEVELRTRNMPADVPFKVLMGKSGSKGVNGIEVGSVRDGDGVLKATFDIPAELQGRSRIDIRMENQATGIYYYLTIENEDY